MNVFSKLGMFRSRREAGLPQIQDPISHGSALPELPYELHELIIKNLPPSDSAKVQLVCTSWKNISDRIFNPEAYKKLGRYRALSFNDHAWLILSLVKTQQVSAETFIQLCIGLSEIYDEENPSIKNPLVKMMIAAGKAMGTISINPTNMCASINFEAKPFTKILSDIKIPQSFKDAAKENNFALFLCGVKELISSKTFKSSKQKSLKEASETIPAGKYILHFIQKKPADSIQYLFDSAKGGCSMAALNLALKNESPRENFNKSIKAGNKDACYIYAFYCLRDGKTAKAAELFMKAYRKGIQDAKMELDRIESLEKNKL